MRRNFLDYVEIVGKTPEQFNGTKKYVSTGAVDFNVIDEEQVEYVDYENKPSRANLETENGDVLFAKMQNTKKILKIDYEKQNYIFSTGFFAVRPRKNMITNNCLYHLLCSEYFLEQKDKNCSGATQKAITNIGLSKINIKIPDLEYQDNITMQLDKIDAIMHSRKQQLSKLDELVKARFVEMFGDPVANEKGWETLSLEKACNSIVDCPHSTPDYTSENTGYMCIRTSIVKKNKILWDKIEYISKEEYIKRIQRKKPEKGDVIYTREGAILGIAAVIDRECNVALGQRSMLLSPNKNKCVSEFLCTTMNLESFLDNILKEISGSASPHINVGDIKSFNMIIPPIDLQNQFATFVEQTDKSKSEIQKSLEKLEMLKKALMQKYFG